MEMEAAPPRAKKRRSEAPESPESEDAGSIVPPPATDAPDVIPAGAGGDESTSQEPPPAAGAGEVDGVDHITGLPDVVLGEVISLLPTKDAARTQVVASRWRHLWRSAPLNLDGGCLPADDEIHAAVITRILSGHQGPGRRFRVSAHHIHHCAATVDAWLQSSALDNLEELDLCDNRIYGPIMLRPPPPPSSAFRFSSSLCVATFSQCLLPDDITQTLQFPQLNKLALHQVSISEGSLHCLIAGSPALECLLLDKSYGFRSVRINSASLRCIAVGTYYEQGVIGLREVIIEDAPDLEKFLYLQRRMDLHVTVIGAPKLETLGCLSDYNGTSRLMLGSTIIQARFHGFEIISSTTPVYTLKTLAVYIFSFSLDLIIDFMKCFPCLEKLYIQSYQGGGKNLWRRKHRDLIKGLDIRLKTIVLNDYRGIRSQVNFASFFVLNARMLESMRFQGGAYNETEWFVAEQHRMLQLDKRASRHARFYGNLEFAECSKHSAKAKIHPANSLPSVTLGKPHTANSSRQRALCREPFLEHTANCLPSAKSDTRQTLLKIIKKKISTAAAGGRHHATVAHHHHHAAAPRAAMGAPPATTRRMDRLPPPRLASQGSTAAAAATRAGCRALPPPRRPGRGRAASAAPRRPSERRRCRM